LNTQKNNAWQVVRELVVAVFGLGALMLMAALGLLMLLAGIKGVTQPTVGYLPVSGTVIDHRTSVERGSPATSSRNRYNLRVTVRYTYTVDGMTYPGLTSLLPIDLGSLSDAKKMEAVIAHRYAKGTPVEVFYNPQEPSKSALERRSWLTGTAALVFGVLLLGGAIGLGLMGLLETVRRLRDGPQSEPWHAELLLWRWLKRGAIGLTALLFVAALAFGWSYAPTEVAIVLALCGVLAALVVLGIRRAKTRPADPPEG